MKDESKLKKFSEIGVLSYLKGKNASQIIEQFRSEAQRIDSSKKHSIRQKILGSDNMSRTLSVTGDLKVTLDHLTYRYENQLQAVCLNVCNNYHQFHLRYVVEKIVQTGQFSCPECMVSCKSTADIILNTFVGSYFDKIKNYEGSILILKKEKIGELEKGNVQKIAIQTQEKTVVQSKDERGVFQIIQLKILQIDSNDLRLKNINNLDIAEKLDELSSEEKSKQFEERQLRNYPGQILINLICFKFHVRIRNPLIHKNCKPSDHKNRLILYSFEHVYQMAKIQKKKVKCIYSGCSNYFDDKNFSEVTVVLESISKLLYEEYKQCIYGEYFLGMYHKNWHLNFAENMLQKYVINRSLVKRYLDEIRKSVQSLLKTANLTGKPKKKIYRQLTKDIQDLRQFNPSIKLSSLERNNKIVVVDAGESNICPVRCINCSNLNAMDAYRVSYLYLSSPEKVCPICSKEILKKNFYQAYYFDLQLMQFIFLQGHNNQIFYDANLKTYFHKLSFFTGRSMKEKLKQELKVFKGPLYKSDMDVKLNKAVKYIPFMDRRCSTNASQAEFNKHFIYIAEDQKIREDIQCPHCGKQARSDYLEYNEELQNLLRANNNTLRWAARSEDELSSTNASILSIKYYYDIKNEYKIKDSRKSIKFYWKNYEGTLIKFPIKFRGCNHPLETAICDFSDILFQAKNQKHTKFRCRYKQCNNEYSSAQEMERISLDIYSKIEDNFDLMRKIINNNEYWIEYEIQLATIIKTSRKFDEKNNDTTEQEMIDKYRNKFTDGLHDLKNRKEIHEGMKKTEEQIDYTKQKIREDNEQFKATGTYKHSNNQAEFQGLEDSLRKLEAKKKRLQEQRNQLLQLEQQENRKFNKTHSINFTKLIKMYEPQVKKLREKKIHEDPFANIEPEDLSEFQTYGNLFLFKYPVPKTEPSDVSLKDLEKAQQELKKSNKSFDINKN